MKIGAWGDTLMIAGGIAAGVSLLLWLILGGTTAGFTRTTMMPLLVMVLIWIAGIMLIAVLIAPVDFERFTNTLQSGAGLS